jgi:hypothetical protein
VCAENAESLLRAATTLQIKGMITRCEEFLMENLTKKNCISMWKLGRTHNCEELEDRAWPMILDNFTELSKNDMFLVRTSMSSLTWLTQQLTIIATATDIDTAACLLSVHSFLSFNHFLIIYFPP